MLVARSTMGDGLLHDMEPSSMTRRIADQVAPCARAFRAVAKQDWAGAEAELIPVMADHARLGGSRAQRDLLELTLLNVLIRQGKAGEARRLLAMRRPLADIAGAVQGLAA